MKTNVKLVGNKILFPIVLHLILHFDIFLNFLLIVFYINFYNLVSKVDPPH